jgi:hypothetical protein
MSIDYNITGRKIIEYPNVIIPSKVGTVTIQIKVDKLGNVVSAKYTSKGSTTTDAYLIGISEKAAMNTKFDNNSNIEEEQFGTMVFVFNIK